MSEKPTRVEVGQRWQFETAVRDVSPDEIRRFESNGRWVDAEGYSWRPEDLLASAKWTFLGYAPSPETGPPVMGERAGGKPAACLFCGSPKLEVYNDWACEPCIVKESIGALAGAKIAWDNGARDFPRRPPMETAAATPKVEPACTKWRTGGDYCGECIECRERIAALRRVPPTPKVEPAPMPPLGPGHPMHAMNESCHPTTGAAL